MNGRFCIRMNSYLVSFGSSEQGRIRLTFLVVGLVWSIGFKVIDGEGVNRSGWIRLSQGSELSEPDKARKHAVVWDD